MIKRILKVSGLVLAGLLATIVIMALIPVGTGDIKSISNPAQDYADAAGRAAAIIADEEKSVCDECQTRFYTHGEKTDKAVVLIHGLSNSPRQFQEMGEELYETGYNVYIPLMPYHGLNSHEVSELSHITVSDLVGYADQSIDIAAGLGDEVVVAGLSGGGSVVAWIAQNREDVDRTVLIAPLIGIKQLPGFTNNFFTNIFSRLPGMDFTSASEPYREHVYRGQSSRGVAEYMLLARGVRSQADDNPSAVKDIVIIINANDDQVNNGMTNNLAEKWQEFGATITTYEFPQSLGLPHDVIDVSNEEADPDTTYPVIIEHIDS
jgi:carboxylesterase